MKSNKKKNIGIIVGVIILFYAIVTPLYFVVQNYTQKQQAMYFTEDSFSYLASDQEFFNKYGKIIALEPIEKKIQQGKIDENWYSMKFICETEKVMITLKVQLIVENEISNWSYFVELEEWK